LQVFYSETDPQLKFHPNFRGVLVGPNR